MMTLLNLFVHSALAVLSCAAGVSQEQSVKGEADGPASRQTALPTDSFRSASPDEPVLERASLTKAAESLDHVALKWTRQHKCGSCHTTWPYLMSRPVLKGPSSPALDEVRKFFEERISRWDAEVKTNVHFNREAVGHAAALALCDALTLGKLQPLTRTALDRMWTLQRADGAWNWTKCGWAPFEIDDYFGALLAAVGVGHAPQAYAQGDSARAGLEKLRGYFKATRPPSLHHKIWLLWAGTRLDGLMTDLEKQTVIKELLALQRGDGGWSMEALGKGWVGRDGMKSNPDAPSDGYGTGLSVFVLHEAQVPANDASVQRGVKWLRANQRESGRWFVRSLNGVEQHYISDAATAFAVLALKACGPEAEPDRRGMFTVNGEVSPGKVGDYFLHLPAEGRAEEIARTLVEFFPRADPRSTWDLFDELVMKVPPQERARVAAAWEVSTRDAWDWRILSRLRRNWVSGLDSALESIEKGERLFPEDPLLTRDKLDLLERLYRPKGVAAAYLRLAKLDPDNKSGPRLHASAQRAIRQLALIDPAEAIRFGGTVLAEPGLDEATFKETRTAMKPAFEAAGAAFWEMVRKLKLPPAETGVGAEIMSHFSKLSDDEFEVRSAAARRLRKIGLPAIPMLLDHIDDQDIEVRSKVREIIRAILSD